MGTLLVVLINVFVLFTAIFLSFSIVALDALAFY